MNAPNPRLIGTTDLAALLGVHPFLTAFQLWKRVTLGEQEDLDRVALRRMETGLLRQEQIVTWWGEDERIPIAPADAPITDRALVVGPYVEHPHGRAWQRVSTDYVLRIPGEVERREGVEVKLTERLTEEWGPAGTDQVPQHYMVQVQGQCEALGWPRAHLLVGWGLYSYRVYTIDAVPELGAELVDIAGDFWTRHVVADVPPPLTETERMRARWAAVRARFAHVGEEREATEEERGLAIALAGVRKKLKTLDAAADGLELELRERMGDAPLIWWGDTDPKERSRVICRPTKPRSSVDWEAAARAAAVSQALIAQHTAAAEPTRPLRVTLKGEEA